MSPSPFVNRKLSVRGEGRPRVEREDTQRLNTERSTVDSKEVEEVGVEDFFNDMYEGSRPSIIIRTEYTLSGLYIPNPSSWIPVSGEVVISFIKEYLGGGGEGREVGERVEV